jgi:hypothetical protein
MDEKAKIERIERIDSEVGELHPLLHQIFPKLERVSYVEYTHGPNEMGADFVIERLDSSLGTSDYIGVVAKSDKILQNFGDVERQIDECGHPRLIRQGKETVRLPEVWVITSKSVSHNAKQKISEKFSTRKVHFFDSAWLARKVDEHAAFFWDSLTSSIGIYLSNLDKRLTVISSQTALVSSQSDSRVSIDLDVEEIDSDRYKKNGSPKRPRLVNMVDEVENNKVTLLEANMGFGKSHLARKLSSHFSEVGVYKTKRLVPVFSTFKALFDARDKDLDNYIRDAIGSQCYADARKEGASFLLVLDGLDEATSDIDRCRDCLADVVRQVRSQPHIRLLITSRPLKLLDDVNAAAASAKRYRIRQLSVAKIVTFLKRVFETHSLPNHLLRDLGKSGLFKQLPQNPIAASLLANLISQEKYELPSNLTELYSKTIELMLGRWDEKRQISTEKLFRTTERLARHIARYMLDNQLVYLSRTEIRQMVEAFLGDRNTGVPPAEAFDYLMTRSNLFGSFDDTDAVFFKHRSFAEYLYARDAYEARDFQIDERAFHPYWINTFFFYIGSLGECPDVLRKLAHLSPSAEPARLIRMLNMGQYLLSAYQTPYSVIQESLDVVLVEAARLYRDIKDGRFDSKLVSMSEMQLLWVFSGAIRHCYGYDFFAKALPLVMAKIDESLLDDVEVKSYALLFAAHALDEVGDRCGFEFLVKAQKPQELPTSVALALAAELAQPDRSVVKSPAVKRFEKTFKQMLTGSTIDRLGVSSKLDLLYQEPLSTRIASRKAAQQPKRIKGSASLP